MNKISKIGLSALCGSLASIAAANAGALDVTGTAETTWTSKSGVVGNPIGMKTGLTFTGNGELDGGQTFAVTITHANKATWSSSNIALTTNSLGTFTLNSGGGGAGIGGFDDNQPRAWEEVWDTGVTTNANLQKGVSGSMNIAWASPTVAGTTLNIAYAPDNDGTQNNNKGVSGSASDYYGAGWDVVLEAKPSWDTGGFHLILGASETEIEVDKDLGVGKSIGGDHQEAVVGLGITIGPVELGYQISGERLRTQSTNTPQYYGNDSWGVAFNVNDHLSASYSRARHLQTKTHKASHTKSGATSNANINFNEYTPKSWMRGDSIQVSYTVGGASVKYAQTEYDNTAYGFDAKTKAEARIVAVSLAF